MSGAVCPACGVAVVPGYVRCPKCHKPLPRRKSTVAEGGTAVERSSRGPLIAVVTVALAGTGLIVFLGTRGGGKPAVTETADPEQAEEAEETQAPEPTRPDLTFSTGAATAPSAQSVADDLKKALTKEKLWSTITIVGERVDVRSGSCNDPAMATLLGGAKNSFKAAGLAKLRCLEQSGVVVTDDDL